MYVSIVVYGLRHERVHLRPDIVLDHVEESESGRVRRNRSHNRICPDSIHRCLPQRRATDPPNLFEVKLLLLTIF